MDLQATGKALQPYRPKGSHGDLIRHVDISRWASGSRINTFAVDHGQYLLSGSMIVCLVVIPNFRVIARSMTARMLGLTAPDKLLATADEVLELLQPVHVVCRGA